MTSLSCNGKLSLQFRSWRVAGLVFLEMVFEVQSPHYIACVYTRLNPVSKHCDFKGISLAPLTKASYINKEILNNTRLRITLARLYFIRVAVLIVLLLK